MNLLGVYSQQYLTESSLVGHLETRVPFVH